MLLRVTDSLSSLHYCIVSAFAATIPAGVGDGKEGYYRFVLIAVAVSQSLGPRRPIPKGQGMEFPGLLSRWWDFGKAGPHF